VINSDKQEAPVIWFTGISGSGKSTLARKVMAELQRQHIPSEFLDGDVVREFFEGDLGYSPPERILNVKRIAFAASLLARHGITTVVANIAPYYEVRDFIRKKTARYLQIFCDASMAKVAERDVKGHYKKHQAGALQSLVGVDDAYDRPRSPDLTVDTDRQAVEESVQQVFELLRAKGVMR